MPKKSVSEQINGSVAKSKVPKKAVRAAGSTIRIKKGEVLIDITKKKWKIGESIGTGGFGEIYSASSLSEDSTVNGKFVIKIEPHTNGPLFSEMHFYHRVGKSTDIEEWISQHKLPFLGMPRFIASGSHEYNKVKYRFMVMERFGKDIQKMLSENNRKLPLKTIIMISLMVLDTLEYIHSKDYVHADIKASNLLIGHDKENQNRVYLVDFGLACKYIINGKHKEYKEDPRKAHDGTIEFASRDAHIGCFSRRGDLETLAFNMLQWSCGKLPWEKNLTDCNSVKDSKNLYMDDIPKLIKACYSNKKSPDSIGKMLIYVKKLSFTDAPDYDFLRKMLKTCLAKEGLKCDGRLEFTIKNSSSRRASKRNSSTDEEEFYRHSPKKRKPLKSKNHSPELFTSDSDTPNTTPNGSESIPTPAMLMVMKAKKLKSEKLNAKKSVNLKSTQTTLNGEKQFLEKKRVSKHAIPTPLTSKEPNDESETAMSSI
ncbi:Serine/threonine-protein kinase VRK1 [Nymphon striatum]|nr:Serine/threonine-protein kinase VRK1 [Nymphon striatum]